MERLSGAIASWYAPFETVSVLASVSKESAARLAHV
jgi:hypothetical protein